MDFSLLETGKKKKKKQIVVNIPETETAAMELPNFPKAH